MVVHVRVPTSSFAGYCYSGSRAIAVPWYTIERNKTTRADSFCNPDYHFGIAIAQGQVFFRRLVLALLQKATPARERACARMAQAAKATTIALVAFVGDEEDADAAVDRLVPKEEQVKLLKGTRLIRVGNIFFALGALCALVSAFLRLYIDSFADNDGNSTIVIPGPGIAPPVPRSSHAGEDAGSNASTAEAAAGAGAGLPDLVLLDVMTMFFDLFEAVG